MRPGVVVAVLFVVCSACSAQQPNTKVITVPGEVEVRSGPSLKFYATSVLRQGEVVEVIGETQPGWLAIKPPLGSFSWIDAKTVTLDPKQPGLGVVSSETPVPVMPGSALSDKAPNVEQVKLERGTQVAIMGKPFSPSAESSYIPIQPPLNEVRYIPADAVQVQQFVGTPMPTAPNLLPSDLGNDLLQQAKRALDGGNVARAKQLYKEALDKSTSYQDKITSLNALASLGDGPVGQPGHPNPTQGVAMTPSGHLAGAAGPLFKTATISRGTTQPPQWSAWGVLRTTPFKCEQGGTMYVLENQKGGQPLLYVTAQTGLSLTNFVGRTVCLYGPITYCSDDCIRMHHMVASHIALP